MITLATVLQTHYFTFVAEKLFLDQRIHQDILTTRTHALVPVYVSTRRNSNNNKPETEICKISCTPFLMTYLGETSRKL